MIPAGYLAKRIIAKPRWILNDHVTDIYSLSNCISKDFADYIDYWKHNGFWLFDSPNLIHQIAQEASIDLSATRLFYYEVYELEFDDSVNLWRAFSSELSFQTKVRVPQSKQLQGFDVVSFYAGTSPECSPLSCCNFCQKIIVNDHCLLDSLDTAKELLEAGAFNNSEPGPFRIFAVYTV